MPNHTAKRPPAQSSTPILTAARNYVRLGWHVFPVVAGTKRPVLSEEDTGRKRGASNDPAIVEQMFRDFPLADIGVVTGAVSGIWVLDVDNKKDKDGRKSLDTLMHQHRYSHGYRPSLPRTATVETPNGVHYYFRHPGRHVRDPTLGRGIDVIGDNLAIVAPPSRGRQWGIGGFSRIASAPAWLLPMICEERPRPPPRARSTRGIEPQEYSGPAPSPEVLDLMIRDAGRGVSAAPEDVQLPEDVELKVQFALTVIPKQDYHEWMRIGGMIACALRGVADDDGQGLWEEWADEVNEYKWSECMKYTAFDSDGRSIFRLADIADPERLWRRAYDIALIKMYQRDKA